jgi:hypothetical protein
MDVAMTIKQRLRDPSLFVERAYVGGEWIDAAGGSRIDVVDPATGASIGTVPALGSRDQGLPHRRIGLNMQERASRGARLA